MSVSYKDRDRDDPSAYNKASPFGSVTPTDSTDCKKVKQFFNDHFKLN